MSPVSSAQDRLATLVSLAISYLGKSLHTLAVLIIIILPVACASFLLMRWGRIGWQDIYRKILFPIALT